MSILLDNFVLSPFLVISNHRLAVVVRLESMIFAASTKVLWHLAQIHFQSYDKLFPHDLSMFREVSTKSTQP